MSEFCHVKLFTLLHAFFLFPPFVPDVPAAVRSGLAKDRPASTAGQVKAPRVDPKWSRDTGELAILNHDFCHPR